MQWRPGDRRLLDAGARGREGRQRRGGLSRREPAAHAVPARPRAGEPLLPLGPPVPRSDPYRRRSTTPACRATRRSTRALAGLAPAFAAAAATTRRLSRRSGAPSARRSKPGARPSPASAPRGRSDPLVADYHAFVERRAAKPCGASPPSRRSPRARPGENWRLVACRPCATATPKAIDEAITSDRRGLRVRPLLPMARRPPAWASRGASARANAASRSASIAISRSAPRRTARNPGRTRAILARGVTIGAPPDPFSAQGQNWSLPAPNPLAGAREGWASSARSTAPTCATRACCASTTRWACSGCF